VNTVETAPTPALSRVSPQDRVRDLRVAGLLAAGTAVVGSALDLGTLCPLRRATGVPCPLCGLTTGVWAAAHADLPTAVASHPLALPALGLLAVAWTPWGPDLVAGLGRHGRAIAVLLTVVWIARLAGLYGA
jgi:Protein of unknown function (DUF2752)